MTAKVIGDPAGEIKRARRYLALQAFAGAMWWVAVFASSDVRSWTLADWDARVRVGPDLVWNVMIRPVEEADLLARFGGDYAAYADVVRCWVPVHRAARAT